MLYDEMIDTRKSERFAAYCDATPVTCIDDLFTPFETFEETPEEKLNDMAFWFMTYGTDPESAPPTEEQKKYLRIIEQRKAAAWRETM